MVVKQKGAKSPCDYKFERQAARTEWRIFRLREELRARLFNRKRPVSINFIMLNNKYILQQNPLDREGVKSQTRCVIQKMIKHQFIIFCVCIYLGTCDLFGELQDVFMSTRLNPPCFAFIPRDSVELTMFCRFTFKRH